MTIKRKKTMRIGCQKCGEPCPRSDGFQGVYARHEMPKVKHASCELEPVNGFSDTCMFDG